MLTCEACGENLGLSRVVFNFIEEMNQPKQSCTFCSANIALINGVLCLISVRARTI